MKGVSEVSWNNTFLEALFSLEGREQRQKEKILKLLEKEGFEYRRNGTEFWRTIECYGVKHVVRIDAYTLHERADFAERYIREVIQIQETKMLDFFKDQIKVVKECSTWNN